MTTTTPQPPILELARKQLSRVEIKDAAKGDVSAVFSTFNVRDSDGDVTLPGAFEEGAPVVISSYNHTSWGGNRPVGKGKIRTTKSEAILDGRFFMDTVDGRETFEVVKGLAESSLGEWSYGFDIEEAESGTFDGDEVQFLKRLKVFEVSPVLRGAGINTRTLAVKALTGPAELAATEYARFTRDELDRRISMELDPIRVRAELLEIRDKVRSLT
jgi:hypothetical protein